MSKSRLDLYTIREVSRFLGFSLEWIRLREAEGLFRYPNGKLIEPERLTPKSENPGKLMQRRYRLSQIVAMADAAHKGGRITTEKHTAITQVLDGIKKVRYLPR
jgi:hypothetical protein